VLHAESDALWLSLCLLGYFGSSALSIPVWCKLAQVYDKKWIWLMSWAISVPATFTMFFLAEGATWSLIGTVALMGASFGGASYLYKAIQADAIDYDELKTTRRREGQYITFWALIPKLVSIPAAAIPLVVIQAVRSASAYCRRSGRLHGPAVNRLATCRTATRRAARSP
jgi:Na+/melibiose symporter-like transporter